MSEEAQTVAQRLDALPEAERQQIAGRFNSYLNKLDDLKAAIQEGLDSGDDAVGRGRDHLRGLRRTRRRCRPSLMPVVSKTLQARRDLRESWRYLDREASEETANRELRRIQKVADGLAAMPQAAPARPELGPEIRFRPIGSTTSLARLACSRRGA